MSKKFYGNLLLFLTAFIWGTSFVAQVLGGQSSIGPFTFNFSRNLVAGFFLLIIVIPFLSSRDKKANNGVAPVKGDQKTLILGGISCGLALFFAMTFQQIGIMESTAGKAGFITALYIVIVPLLGVFIGKRVTLKMWACVVIAAIGMYLLSFKSGFNIGKGDILLLICAVLFSIHILVIDHFSPKVDGVKMSCIQFFVSALLSLVLALVKENVVFANILESAIPILYVGILSSGIGYTLQIVAQKDTDPTVASLILSLESVFAAISGAIYLHERMTPRELLGCAIMMAAIVYAQVPEKRKLGRLN